MLRKAETRKQKERGKGAAKGLEGEKGVGKEI